MQFMKLLMKLEDLTSKPVCKLCFNNFYPNTFNSFFNKTHLLCPKCFKKLKIILKDSENREELSETILKSIDEMMYNTMNEIKWEEE